MHPLAKSRNSLAPNSLDDPVGADGADLLGVVLLGEDVLEEHDGLLLLPVEDAGRVYGDDVLALDGDVAGVGREQGRLGREAAQEAAQQRVGALGRQRL
ncbi:hypothetical protein CHU98_g8785, partial [Xylaria longipes]